MNVDLPRGPRWPAIAQTLAFTQSPFNYLERCRRRYGKRFTIRTTSTPPLVFISDPAEVKALFAASAEVLRPGEGATVLEPIVGPGAFLLMDGEDHLQVRRDIAPSFHKGVSDGHGDLVTGLVEREVASWPRDTPVALHPRCRALALEVILRTTFVGRDDERIIVLRDRLLSALTITSSPTMPLPWLRKLPPQRGVWKRFEHRLREADDLMIEMIEERRMAGAGGDDMLGTLLAGTEGEDAVRQVRDHVMSVILAGHETTSSELAWAFQLLAHNLDAQDGLLGEIDEDAGDQYLTATVQEVMRRRPPFLFATPRAATRPTDLGGWTYGPPAHLLGCIYLLHHDPEIYPEPHAFRPERFLEAPPDPLTWIPWGGGRRFCPGLHLATLEIKAVLKTLLSSVVIRPAAKAIEPPAWRSVLVTPQKGSRVILRARPKRGIGAPDGSAPGTV